MTERQQRAQELHGKGYNCAQSVACAYCDLVGLDEQTAYKMAEGFGLGMGVIATGFDNIPNSAKMDMDGAGLQRKAAPAQTGSGLSSNASAEDEQKPAAKPQASSDVGSDDAAFDVLMRIFDKDHR